MDRITRRRFIRLQAVINDLADLWESAKQGGDDAGGMSVDNLNRAHDIVSAERLALLKHTGLTERQVREETGDGE